MHCPPFYGMDRVYEDVIYNNTYKNKTVSMTKHFYRQVRDLKEESDLQFIVIILSIGSPLRHEFTTHCTLEPSLTLLMESDKSKLSYKEYFESQQCNMKLLDYYWEKHILNCTKIMHSSQVEK